jgi:hypothetical protein
LKETGGIVIVGPCASGKSSLAARLTQAGWAARQIAQEHSYVPTMWQKLSQPDVLIFLDASYESCTARKNLDWTEQEYRAQQDRLTHARQYCDVYINTDPLTVEEVYQRALAGLSGGQPPNQSL